MKKQLPVIGCFLTVIALISVMTVGSFTSEETISKRENRALKPKPKWSLESYFSGEYLRGWEDFIADHIPGRDFFLEAANTLEDVQGIESDTSVVEVNADMGVASEDSKAVKQDMLVLDDRILEVYTYSKENCQYYVDTINKYAVWLPEQVNFYSMLIPTRIEYEESKYRKAADSQKEALRYINSKLKARATRVHVYNALKKHKDEDIYFRTDHHWTALGAYYGAREFGKMAGFEMAPIEAYLQESKEGYLGYLYNQAPSEKIAKKPDRVDYYSVEGKNNTTEVFFYENHDSQTMSSFENTILDKDFAEEKGDYGIFLGGDYPLTVIDGDGPQGKVLAVIKDSYGNAFVPWLAPHFDTIVAIDPRTYHGDLAQLLADYQVSDFLIMNYMKVTMSAGFIDQINGLIDPPGPEQTRESQPQAQQ